jgi:hypothetical protein
VTVRRTSADQSRKPWDWSSARVTDAAPCDLCGTPTILRHPDNPRIARHKTCEDRAIQAQQTAA